MSFEYVDYFANVQFAFSCFQDALKGLLNKKDAELFLISARLDWVTLGDL